MRCSRIAIKRGLREAVKQTLEVAGGLLTANAGDLANTYLMSLFLAFLLENKYLLALIPIMAALRGSVATSMSARVSTRLYLGVFPPVAKRILNVELKRTVALSLLSSLIAGIIISLLTLYPSTLMVGAGVLSALLAILVIIPIAVVIVVVAYRNDLNPDNFTAPILTVVGDITTVPTLVISALLITNLPNGEIAVGLFAAYLAVTYSIYAYITGRNDRRIITENMISLLIVLSIESGTGSLLSGYSAALFTLGIIHLVPSIMEDVGASLAVLASRLTSEMHLMGLEDSIKRMPYSLVIIVVGSLPSMTILSTIGYLTAGIAGVHVQLGFLLKTIAATWLVLLGLISLVVILLVWLSVRIGLDPDNVVVPMVTSIVDLSVIPVILLLSRIVV